MKVVATSIIAIAVLSTGCSNKAPYIAQGASALYRSQLVLSGKPSENAYNASINLKATALDYAQHSDESASNAMYNDMISGALIGGAGVGALTTAHSDLYKSLGALFGLSMGHKFYFNASEQRKIYLLGAEAAACSSIAVSKLARELEGIEQKDIEAVYDSVDPQTTELKSFLYDPSKISALGGTPFLVAALVNGAVNADQDATKTKETLRAIMYLEETELEIRKKIFTYINNEIYRTSFKSDESLQKIASYAVSPADLLSVLKKAGASGRNDAYSKSVQSADVENGENLLRKRLPRITEIINEQRACLTTLPAVPSPS
ncbi:hypothetical protein [Metapseudomonas otitidis]|uniref:hypothetical protein n=1 Tax=Metapseudomonas otitidis TaxID=319939 RepID=UPI0013F671CA|nr:hypothetical protein [Pseudomonas otitidis]